jgi:hypothetical protein
MYRRCAAHAYINHIPLGRDCGGCGRYVILLILVLCTSHPRYQRNATEKVRATAKFEIP